jgi:hypothetical protein
MRAKESASDLVQSLCREVLSDLSRFEYRGEVAFRHWLYTQAAHKLIDRHRGLTAEKRDARREVPLDDGGSAAVLSCYGTLCTPSRALSAQEAVASIEGAFATRSPTTTRRRSRCIAWSGSVTPRSPCTWGDPKARCATWCTAGSRCSRSVSAVGGDRRRGERPPGRAGSSEPES